MLRLTLQILFNCNLNVKLTITSNFDSLINNLFTCQQNVLVCLKNASLFSICMCEKYQAPFDKYVQLL